MARLMFCQTPFMGWFFYLDIQKVTFLKFLIFLQRNILQNLLLEVCNIVNSSCINWAQIKCCCCTDSPSTMIKFCHLLNERHKYIIVFSALCIACFKFAGQGSMQIWGCCANKMWYQTTWLSISLPCHMFGSTTPRNGYRKWHKWKV